jgi:hypothetical protein
VLASEGLGGHLRGPGLLASVFLVKALGGDLERASKLATR